MNEPSSTLPDLVTRKDQESLAINFLAEVGTCTAQQLADGTGMCHLDALGALERLFSQEVAARVRDDDARESTYRLKGPGDD